MNGDVKYTLLDRFDWNKGSHFVALNPFNPMGVPLPNHVSGDQFNLLEKCGRPLHFGILQVGINRSKALDSDLLIKDQPWIIYG